MNGRARTFAHVFATFGAGGPQVRAAMLFGRLGPGCRHVVMAMDGRTDAMAQVPPGLSVALAPPPARAGFRATVRAQRAWLAEVQPDLVLTYNWGAIETVFAARAARVPLVHHEDGFGPEEATRRLLRRNWIRWWALRGVPVVVPSLVLQGIAAREWHLQPARVHHLPNGVDLQRFAPGPTLSGPMVVGTVGGLRPEKDHASLLRALAQLPAAATIVGGGALDADLRALAASLGVADRVRFAGPVADTAACYRSFQVFVLSSRTEQMPIALLEAMASGLPVVATDVGDVRAILPDEQQPFVVRKEDPAALAAALRAVLADAGLRQRLGAANRRVVEQRYEAGQCLDRFVAAYEAAIRSRCRS